MSYADRLTASRLFLAPFFFLLFMWGEAVGIPSAIVAIALVILFAVIELSDLFDGMVARNSGTVSSFGKVFDPFADVFARITYFVCFAWAAIMPLWVLLIVLYREFGILFLRMMLAQRGIAMGARPGGKAKAVVYMTAGALSLLYWSLPKIGLNPGSIDPILRGIIFAFYLAAAILSVASFIDYWIQFRKLLPASSR
ncbi:MAG TPA: CDP-alcohol phosphatidyltransferase family protein [Rectinemataceae bacterium]|nr:CDP-alcohol phosphatidyltransferase family protein [Rectinemataceae bacterium]